MKNDNIKPNTGEKSKRYQGYNIEKAADNYKKRKKPWFWKVLLISLLLTFIIIAAVCTVALRKKKQQTDYLSKINDANTMDILLEDHSNMTITQSYSGLKDENDYKKTRFFKKSKKGTLFTYLKTEGLDADYKEVMSGKNLYRYDGSFTYYYGFVGDDYDNYYADVEGTVLQLEGTETVKDQTESTDIMKVTLEYEVQAGDNYTKLYGYGTGTVVQKVLTIDKESLIVTSDVETVDGDEIYSYAVTFDGDNKNPEFYRNMKKKTHTRECSVVYNCDSDDAETYTYTIKVDTYFNLLDHEGYKVYMDKDCTTEFTTTQMQVQNPYDDLTLYMKKGE